MSDLDPSSQGPSETEDRKIIPHSVIAARLLFFLIAAIWILFGIVSLLDSGVDSALTIGILMFVNAAVMMFIGWGIGKQSRRYLYLGLIVLAGNIFLTITDQFGWFDMIVLIIYVVLFLLLLATRAQYQKP